MRLLQIHEYLDLLQPDGAGAAPADDLADQACLNAAHRIWNDTGLQGFHEIVRRVEYAAFNPARHCRLVHIGGDHPDCFVIVAFDTQARQPIGYIVFDIGAEYRNPVFYCPAANHAGPATPELIEEWIPRLGQHADEPIAVLDRGRGTYLCAWQQPDGSFGLNHQLVTPRNCYVAVDELQARDVIEAFHSYAFKVKEWTTQLQWEWLEDE